MSREAPSFDHLAPLRLTCSAEGAEIGIRVIFTNHCYSERFDPERHLSTDIMLYDGAGRPRVFSPERYALSQGLPAVIRSLPGQRVYQTSQRRNFVFMTSIALDARDYCVFFVLQRERRDGAQLRLTVESAYLDHAQRLRPRLPGKIRFEVLALKTLRGEPIRFAPR